MILSVKDTPARNDMGNSTRISDILQRITPQYHQVGKHAFVGYQRWLQSLEDAVAIFGRERVYSAMVAGIELEPEFDMDWESASALVIEGAEALCAKGILPIYSLYWPVGGRGHPEYLPRLRAFFESLNLAYGEIRRRHELSIWEGFMCHRCAYMQLECDLDRALEESRPEPGHQP